MTVDSATGSVAGMGTGSASASTSTCIGLSSVFDFVSCAGAAVDDPAVAEAGTAGRGTATCSSLSSFSFFPVLLPLFTLALDLTVPPIAAELLPTDPFFPPLPRSRSRSRSHIPPRFRLTRRTPSICAFWVWEKEEDVLLLDLARSGRVAESCSWF